MIQDWDPYQGMENTICGLLYGQPKEEEGKKDKWFIQKYILMNT